jgi:hypothetical protein
MQNKSLFSLPEKARRYFGERKSCQAPMLGGGDFSVSADKKKNTTARGLTKNKPNDPHRRDPTQNRQTGTPRPQSGSSPCLPKKNAESSNAGS